MLRQPTNPPISVAYCRKRAFLVGVRPSLGLVVLVFLSVAVP